MRWLPWRSRRPTAPQRNPAAARRVHVVRRAPDPWPDLAATLICATCGRPLGDDPEDEPDGDAGMPICGECDRQRDWDAMEL